MFTISWLPAALVIRDLRVWPEPGVNLTLDQTLRHVTGQRQRVSAWGPYEVPADTFGRLARQYQKVAGGCYRYQAGDALNPDPLVANCIRAVSEADPRFGRARYPVLRVAEPVGTHIVRLLVEQDRIIDLEADHSGLLAELGVTAYPVTYREFRADTGLRPWDVGWRRRSGSGERGVSAP